MFSAIPSTTDQTGYEARFGKVAEWLSERLGVTVKYQHSADYAQSVAAFVSGDVLFAWFGGLTGVQARHRVEGAHAIAQGKEDPNFYSYFIAHKDTASSAATSSRRASKARRSRSAAATPPRAA